MVAQNEDEHGQVIEVDVAKIRLDPENYRFPREEKGATQSELLRILDRDYELLVVGRSLADNGYFSQEPLVLTPIAGTDEFTVVEGNRRVAALKLLLEPALRHLSEDDETWTELAGQLKHPLSRVPAVVYPSKDAVLVFLGHRHVAGIRKWDPLAKARFIDALVSRSRGSRGFEEIAREIGSKGPTVRDNYVAYRLLLQAQDAFSIDVSRAEKHFSVFYRALNYTEIQDYLGLDKRSVTPTVRDPVSRDRRSQLEELIGFVHGLPGKSEAVVRDSRQLSRLAQVLPKPDALRALRISRNLDLAWKVSGGETRQVLDNLEHAEYYLREALRDAFAHKDDASVQRRVLSLATTVAELLRNFPAARKEVTGSP
jgi:hypothetical protein